MGQVPKQNLNGLPSGDKATLLPETILIIGSGRLAQHFAHYLNLLGLNYRQWNRSQPIEELLFLLESTPVVALAIRDSAIGDFALTYLSNYSGKVVHFSGATHVEGLLCAHPLFTFGHDLYDLSTYQRIPFAVTDAPNLQTIFTGLPNSSFTVAPHQKVLYHACAVASGNFVNLLLREVSHIAQNNLQISWQYFLPFLEQTVRNSFADPDHSLTGPFVRGDIDTIVSHLKVLEGSPLNDIYKSFLKTYDRELLARVEVKR